MLEYAVVERDRRKFLALTGLTVKEFKLLSVAFSRAYRQTYQKDKALTGRKRKRRPVGGAAFSTGGVYSLDGTIGQFDAGTLSNGG